VISVIDPDYDEDHGLGILYYKIILFINCETILLDLEVRILLIAIA
jgi:hypothetical protein